MAENEATNPQPVLPSTIGRYTVRLGAPILDTAMWYVEQPNPLGEPSMPLVRAMCITRRMACRVAAGLACFDACRELLAWLADPAASPAADPAHFSARLVEFLAPIRDALAFGRRS